jgi:hypothetical protein
VREANTRAREYEVAWRTISMSVYTRSRLWYNFNAREEKVRNNYEFKLKKEKIRGDVRKDALSSETETGKHSALLSAFF